MDDWGWWVDQLLTDQKPLEWILHAFRGGKIVKYRRIPPTKKMR
ncbi:MAG: hypothetical protein ACLVAT_02760 [Lachnospiraceae bacterium]